MRMWGFVRKEDGMMREIKFRAWDKKNRIMYTPSYEFDRQGELCTDIRFCNECESNNDNDLEVMQFTGLKDKNNKEIYEGDIIRTEEGIGEVRWYQPYCCFLVGIDNYWDDLNRLLGKHIQIEVIGNIYENLSF